ncbi:two component transcriptional regulator, winged helix family [Burkholderia lata]|uniref:Two component transcriptional regulator, winged helix family n=2 Tax=Burkholderia lata (strain ATCC 17760 / DSM 23089 / LMG 22485 / NCIMB 9086 / R18194 / 383) TaxID=482957 RepID=Q398T9_BURL3|nr:two component transcriptional regulator, winged helix family [Burkholderia lata]
MGAGALGVTRRRGVPLRFVSFSIRFINHPAGADRRPRKEKPHEVHQEDDCRRRFVYRLSSSVGPAGAARHGERRCTRRTRADAIADPLRQREHDARRQAHPRAGRRGHADGRAAFRRNRHAAQRLRHARAARRFHAPAHGGPLNPHDNPAAHGTGRQAMEQSCRIVVLDDEAELRNMLQRFLTGHGFQVRAVADGKRLDRLLQREPYDLLVLDLMMEPEDGLSVCRRLRAEGQTLPILMLTAKGDAADKVVGLETGADDYLAKPFLPDELVARVRALLRRQKMAAGEPTVTSQRLRFGAFTFDVGQQTLMRDGTPVEIHSAQMLLLHALGSSPNRAVSRENLLARARGRDHAALDRSVDVQILRLRQIVEDDPGKPRFIKTVWGIGYMLVAGVDS